MMKKLLLSLFILIFAVEGWAQTNVTPKSVTPISAKNAKVGATNEQGKSKISNVLVQGTDSEEYVVGNAVQAEAPISSPDANPNSGNTASNKNLSSNSNTKENRMEVNSSQGRPSPTERKKIALPKDVKEPDDSGVIMLVRLIELSAVAMTNPFEIRVQPTIATVDTEIFVGGIIHGETADKDATIINGLVYSTDEFVSGFRIYSIRESNVILEYKDKLLIVPRDKKIVIRLPQQI